MDQILVSVLVGGLSHPKQRNCSNCSTSTIFGPELDMTISYQFLEGAKLGSLCVGHFWEIQDGGRPPSWKIEKRPYIRIDSTALHKIWNGDAYWHYKAHWQLKF